METNDNDKLLKKDLQEAIQKNLPAQVAGELRKRLEELDSKDRLIQTLEETCEDQHELIVKQVKQLDQHGILDKRFEAVSAREADIEKADQRITTVLLEKDLECEKAKNDNTYAFMTALLRNAEFRKEVLGKIGSVHENKTTSESRE